MGYSEALKDPSISNAAMLRSALLLLLVASAASQMCGTDPDAPNCSADEDCCKDSPSCTGVCTEVLFNSRPIPSIHASFAAVPCQYSTTYYQHHRPSGRTHHARCLPCHFLPRVPLTTTSPPRHSYASLCCIFLTALLPLPCTLPPLFSTPLPVACTLPPLFSISLPPPSAVCARVRSASLPVPASRPQRVARGGP